jgi:hypothetical protein
LSAIRRQNQKRQHHKKPEARENGYLTLSIAAKISPARLRRRGFMRLEEEIS